MAPDRVSPGAEVCNGIDDDDNGVIDDWVGGYKLALVWPTGLRAGHPPIPLVVYAQDESVAGRTNILDWPDASIETITLDISPEGEVVEYSEVRHKNGALRYRSETRNGVQVSHATYSTDGSYVTGEEEPVHSWRIEHDEQGRPLRRVVQRGPDTWVQWEDEWLEDKDSGVMIRTLWNAQGDVLEQLRTDVDDQGRILREALLLLDGSLSDVQVEYHYDGDRLVEELQLDVTTGEEAYRKEFQWTDDTQGRLVQFGMMYTTDDGVYWRDVDLTWGEGDRLISAVETTSDTHLDAYTGAVYGPHGYARRLVQTGFHLGELDDGSYGPVGTFQTTTTLAWDAERGVLESSASAPESGFADTTLTDTFTCR